MAYYRARKGALPIGGRSPTFSEPYIPMLRFPIEPNSSFRKYGDDKDSSQPAYLCHNVTSDADERTQKTPIEYLTVNRIISRFNLTLNEIIVPANSFYTILDIPLQSNTTPWIKRVNFDIFVAVSKHALRSGKHMQCIQYLHDGGAH